MASKKYSKREKDIAEERLANEVINKIFWNVDDYQDNCEDLQHIVDVSFNSIEGNNYVVEYAENQSGTRLVINCKVCGKELSSYDPFIAHENGKHHKKVRQKLLTKPDPNIEDELRLQSLNRPRRTFAEGSLEDQIDSTSSSVLGVQFVYKEVIDGEDTYTCQLCQKYSSVYQISASRMFTHLTSSHHNQNYLEAKFGYLKKSSQHLRDECQSVEEFEGRIHTSIIDLTPPAFGDGNKRIYKRDRSRSASPSTSNGRTSKIKSETNDLHSDFSDSDESVKATSPSPERCTKPETCDVGVSANMSSDGHYVVHEINALQEPDCLMVLHDDEDMQNLLQETLWVLTNKMEKYYNETGAMYVEGKTKIPLSVCARKVKKYIADYEQLK